MTGLARSTVAQRVDALLAHGLVYEAGGSASTGGRPPTVLAFNRDAGVVLVADLGATHSRLAVSDLAGDAARRARRTTSTSRAGPKRCSSWVHERFDELLERGRARPPTTCAASASACPARSSSRSGRAGQPADHARLGRLLDPGLVRRAATTRRCSSTTTSTSWRSASTGRTGATSSTCSSSRSAPASAAASSPDGRIHRGAQGAAGDIGHIRVAGHDDVVCRCGNIGCLEAVAGGRALARAARGRRAATRARSRDVVAPRARGRRRARSAGARRRPLPRRGAGRRASTSSTRA